MSPAPLPSPLVPPPPPAPSGDVVDMIHGVAVADPFRVLEDSADQVTVTWSEAQRARTESVLTALPRRDELRARLRDLLSARSSVSCAVAGARVFSIDRWGDHDQAVLVVRDTDRPGHARTLVDAVALAGDATAAIDWFQPSPDGRLVTFGVSTGGDERSTLYILDADSGELRRDRIPHTRACSVAWSPDGLAFAYTRYPDPSEVDEPEDQEYWRKVFWHRLGDDWQGDELLWGDLPDRTAWANISLSPDGRWLLVHLSLGWTRVDVHLIDRSSGARTTMIEGVEAVSTFEVVHDRGDDWVVGMTTLGADRGRMVRAPVSTAWHERWQTIVPEGDRVLDAFTVTTRSLLVLSSLDAVAHLDRFGFDGHQARAVSLPELGSLAGLHGSRDRDEAFFAFTSFTRPPSLFRWTPAGVAPWSHVDDEHEDGAGGATPTDYVVEQVRYPAPDGTPIPMFLMRHVTTVPGPQTPCVLSAYGGFGISLGPSYGAAIVAVCDDGGIYAVANIRGGGERGESWHQAGMLAQKQTSFDDFFTAADWLVAAGLTSRPHLAIRGGSNGGLLMGAAVTQRPDLCRAVQIAVPLLDMVRYHRFLIARLWIPEYGDPDHPDHFRWLYAYSPYHRVVDGTCYPAVLLTTAEEDSRVDPSHARKMAARLQQATACGERQPILLREEPRAGHGQGKPVSKQSEELADVLAFLRWQLAGDRYDDPSG